MEEKKIEWIIEIERDILRFNNSREELWKLIIIERMRIKIGKIIKRGKKIIEIKIGMIKEGEVIWKRDLRIKKRIVELEKKNRMWVKKEERVEKCEVKIGVDKREVIMMEMNL